MGIALEVDARQYIRLSDVFAAAPQKAPSALARAVNRTGDQSKTQVVRALVSQTGLKRKVIVKAVKNPVRASPGALVFKLQSKGGDVAMKFFGARETRRGVSAAPWNRRRVYTTTFLKGGRFPKRVALSMGGHVFKRTGASRKPIEKQKSGLFIPNEMVEGASASAFNGTVRSVLPARLKHELGAILSGYVK